MRAIDIYCFQESNKKIRKEISCLEEESSVNVSDYGKQSWKAQQKGAGDSLNYSTRGTVRSNLGICQ